MNAAKLIQASTQEQRESAKLNALIRIYLIELTRLQFTEFATLAVPSTQTSQTRTSSFLIGSYRIIEVQCHLASLIAFSTSLGMAAENTHCSIEQVFCLSPHYEDFDSCVKAPLQLVSCSAGCGHIGRHLSKSGSTEPNSVSNRLLQHSSFHGAEVRC